jgi:predicted  nucleic acid-binding Zn-ribbon protein
MGILSDARKLIGQAKNEIESLNLKEKSSRTDILLGDIDKKAKVITSELQDTSEHLRVTSENLQKLSDNLTRNPSELIFSKPPPPRKVME